MSSPTIESPITPATNFDVPDGSGFYQTYPVCQDSNVYGMERLRIEELPPDSSQQEKYFFESYSQESMGFGISLYGQEANNHPQADQSSLLKIERPTVLDLFGLSKKKSGFIFNKSN